MSSIYQKLSKIIYVEGLRYTVIIEYQSSVHRFKSISQTEAHHPVYLKTQIALVLILSLKFSIVKYGQFGCIIYKSFHI